MIGVINYKEWLKMNVTQCQENSLEWPNDPSRNDHITPVNINAC